MTDLISRADAIEAIIAEGRTVDSRYLESERIVHECDAVEALAMLPSARPTGGDLISRADALEQMAQAECGLHYDDCKADNCSCSYIQRILDIPSARPTGEWIPCSESLPSDRGKYLVTQTYITDGERYVSTLWYGEAYPLMNGNENNETLCWFMSDSEGDYELDNVIAWMTLPEPYKGGDDK